MDNLVSEFEEHLNLLTLSIQRYAPNPSAASLLISDVDNIGTQLDHLQSILSFKSNQSLKQNVQNHQLNDNLKNILISLNESRKVLNDLPKLSIEKEIELKQNWDNIGNAENHGNDNNSALEILHDTKTVLSFALKLSKFSKIPRTFDGFLLPNNFIWPGDDNMRRGMLAMASMIPDKIINDENKSEDGDKSDETSIIKDSNKNNNNADDNDNDNDQMEEDYDFLPERRNSVGNIDKKEAATVMAELNLLDDSDDD